MRKLIPLLAFLFVMPSLAQGIYKWVDDQGQLHYTDTPQENSGAEEVELKPYQTFSLPSSVTESADTEESSAAEKDEPVYKVLEITSPSMEETIWNTGGIVTAALRLQPGLQMGHTIRVSLDGRSVAKLPRRASSYQMTGVERGEHQIQMEVLDENGSVAIKAKPVTFFYQQTSVNRRPGIN